MAERAIILVDDDTTILSCLREELERTMGAEFVYEAAGSVAEAWEIIEDLETDEVEIAAVISDWLMPGTKGDQFLVDLRERRPRTGRLLLTGQADLSAIQRARDEGAAHGVLTKPWSPDELRHALCEALAA